MIITWLLVLGTLILPNVIIECIVLSPYYSLSWEVNGDSVIFKIEAKTQGWVGLGFNNKGVMKGADIVVAGVKRANGQSYVYDLHGVAHDLPPSDTKQGSDYNVEWSQSNGTHTSLRIKRLLNTGDTDDYQITPGSPVTVIYAIGSSEARSVINFDYHGPTRGHHQVVIQ